MLFVAVGAPQKGNAPEGGKADDAVNDAADKAVRTAEECGNQIESEKPDAAPVQAAYDGKDQRDLIQKHN